MTRFEQCLKHILQFEGGYVNHPADRGKATNYGITQHVYNSWNALKGRTLDEAAAIRNTDIVQELNLPPVKIHCSVLAEDAIKSAIDDFRKKQAARRTAGG